MPAKPESSAPEADQDEPNSPNAEPIAEADAEEGRSAPLIQIEPLSYGHVIQLVFAVLVGLAMVRCGSPR
jgi:hypothetical protein